MPRLLALSALFAVALLSAILPLIHELTDPVKVSVQVPILSHALPTNAPPAFQIEQVTSNVVAENGITGTVATLNVSPSGGTVDVLFSSGGKSMRSLSLAGSLEGSGVIQVLQKSTVGWLNIGTEEPVDRDGPGTFAVGPVVVNGQSVVLRLGVLPAVGNRQALRLRILRAHAVIADTPSALPICPASGCTGAPGMLSGPKLNIQTAASNQNLGTSTSSSDPAIISRTAWGCPDGEQSPNWVPFYERPFHIVIHHTASPPGPNGSAADIQNVWSFHTKDRAWGDIGYNYLIDPMGRVYSGRAGGPEVAGAHTKNFNFGSIGISLIGNYDAARPSSAMLRSLTKLVTELSNHYGIDPLSTSSQNGVAFSNIAGHRDLNSTSCPGTYAYRLLQAIRRQVAQQVRSGVSLDMEANQVVKSGAPSVVAMSVRNTGTTTWSGRFSLNRISGPLLNLPSSFHLPDVAPGKSITIPLFLPALSPGKVYASRWQLADASGIKSGTSFSMSIMATAPSTVTPTAKPTSTPRPSSTPTIPPTHTPSPTRSATPTHRPTSTPSATPTHRPSSTPTRRPTSTPTATATRTPIPTHTATSAPTGTATPRPRPTQTLTPTSTQTPTATLTGTPEATSTPTVIYSPTTVPSSALGAHNVRSVQGGKLLAGGGVVSRALVSKQSAGRAVVANHMPSRLLTSRLLAKSRQVLPTADYSGVVQRLWYFAEGSSYHADRETLAFINPGPKTALILTLLIREGGHRVYAVTDVQPHSRGTLDAGFAAGEGDLLAAVVRSTVPIVAERTVYHGSPSEEGTAGALTTGLPATSHVWYLPRLSIAKDERERVSILNPAARPAHVAISFVRHGVLQPPKTVLVQPISVKSVAVPDNVTSAVVTSSASSGGVVVEERTIYDQSRGYTVLPGIATLSSGAFLPSPSASDTHDYVMVLNPNAVPAVVGLSAVGSNAVPTREFTVAARSQLLVQVRARDAGNSPLVRMRSTRPVALDYIGLLRPSTERSLAHEYRGSVVATLAKPSTIHVFAEGDSRRLLSNPVETLQVTNPGHRTALVTITMFSTGGRINARPVTVPSGGAVRIPINHWGPAGQHGLVVVADSPVIAARTVDLNRFAIRLQSYGATP